MKELLAYGVSCGICFLGFVVLLLIGIFKKKHTFLFLSLIFLAFFITTGIIVSYKFVNKSYNHVNSMFEPRSGIEIYTSLFGEPSSDCVKVIHKQDQVIPKIDYAIFLHFKTCPEELSRILVLRDFEFDKSSTNDWNYADHPWFKPELLGDTILIYSCWDIRGNGQILYCNQDSTEVYCKDIWD